jgi:hypothetical protein
MMKAIFDKAKEAGFAKNDCIVCHGGNPRANKKHRAHKGTIPYFLEHEGPKAFYPDPGSPWINQNSCGMCHAEQVNAQYGSLMFTEAGKIQGTLWSFASNDGYKHNVGNYNVTAPTDPHARLGEAKYKSYMEKLVSFEPQVFPIKMEALPKAPTAAEVVKNPKLAAITYLRQECQRCHTGIKGEGREKKGEFRGIGCTSCHVVYSNSGRYEGKDTSLSTTETGHPLMHRIVGTREAKAHINGVDFSGIPVETCTTCHNRGKRIGVSYQGLMESAYSSPSVDGEWQGKLHSKHYMHMKEDIHYQKGMLCQDCHTSNDSHGDGMIAGTNLAAVEIECQDCHGTTRQYPWELPLGYSEEFGQKLPKQERGLSSTLLDYLKKGTVYPVQDGYLLSARGNPLGNVVRKNNEVIVHLASGKDITLQPLKKLTDEKKLSKAGEVAMVNVKGHMDNLECYACHATWAPQCYGCHIKIDYSGGKKNIDWLAAGHAHDLHGTTADMRKSLKSYLIDGKVTETRSYLRYEDPPLSINGEGRVSPTVPGCQTTITVIGPEGDKLLENHIFKVPNVEGAGDEGQNAIDMSPIQPHTIQKESRSCESCHTDKKALGYGIMGAESVSDPSKAYVIDTMSADKKQLSRYASEHIGAIPNLKFDYSKYLDENGTQIQTVGHHFSLSSPLPEDIRAKLDRTNVCISCHQSIPEGDLAVSVMTHMAQMAEVEIDTNMHEDILSKSLKMTAWGQVGLAFIFGVIVLLLLFKVAKKIKRKRKK